MKKSAFHAVRQKDSHDDLQAVIAQALRKVREEKIPGRSAPSSDVSLEEFLRTAPEETVKKAFPLLTVFGGKASSSVFRERLGLSAPNAWISYVREAIWARNAH